MPTTRNQSLPNRSARWRAGPSNAASANPAYLAKYQGKIEGYEWTVDWFAANYPVILRITPTRWRVA